MRHATLYGYQIAMDAGVVLRNQRLKTREGLLVKLMEGEAQGWGEIAPLPAFSHETLDQAQQQAMGWLARWCGGESPEESECPSVAFGISCAQAELTNSLLAEGEYRLAQLCSGDPDALFQQLLCEPEPLAKMKVGLYEAIRDGMQVNLLLEALPRLTLRLDANRSWTLEKALNFARYVSPELRPRIAFIEEPCRDRQQSLAFAAETGMNIAWDETLRDSDDALTAAPGVVAVVIKPMLTGSIQRVQHQVSEARAQGLTPVISSALESSFGLTQLARLAHELTPGVRPGLDTLQLMQQQVLRAWPGSELPMQDGEALQCLWQR